MKDKSILSWMVILLILIVFSLDNIVKFWREN